MGTDEYRAAGVDDVGRMQLQFDLLSLGSAGFDMEMDTFDPHPPPNIRTQAGLGYAMDPASPPGEITKEPKAAYQQQRLIDAVHTQGGEVLASCHALTRLPTAGVLAVARLAEERGADMIKVVRFNQRWEDIVETMESAVALRRQSQIPYVMMAMGEYGKLTRLMAPLLGSMLCFCKRTYVAHSFTDQPLIHEAKAFFESVDHRITPHAEEFLPDWYARPTIDERTELGSILHGVDTA
jgi:hypothetical protein